MAGELRMKQVMDEEVKPIIRKTIPEILKKISILEALFADLSSEVNILKKQNIPVAKAEIPKRPKTSKR